MHSAIVVIEDLLMYFYLFQIGHDLPLLLIQHRSQRDSQEVHAWLRSCSQSGHGGACGSNHHFLATESDYIENKNRII